MGDVKFILGLHNRGNENGDATIEQLKATLETLGHSPNAAEPIRDANGKLVSVQLNLPDTASDAAVNAINAHAGVATAGPPLPTPLFLTDLSNIVLTPTVLDASENLRVFVSGDSLFGRTFLGQVTGNGSTNTFTDTSNTNPGRLFAAVSLFASQGTNGFTIGSNEITITDTVLGAINLANVQSIIVPAPAPFTNNEDIYYIDNTGNVYLGFRIRDDVLLINRTYAQAIASNPGGS